MHNICLYAYSRRVSTYRAKKIGCGLWTRLQMWSLTSSSSQPCTSRQATALAPVSHRMTSIVLYLVAKKLLYTRRRFVYNCWFIVNYRLHCLLASNFFTGASANGGVGESSLPRLQNLGVWSQFFLSAIRGCQKWSEWGPHWGTRNCVLVSGAVAL